MTGRMETPGARKSKRKSEAVLDADGPPDVQRAAIVEQRRRNPGEPSEPIEHRAAMVEPAQWKDPADTGTAARMYGSRTVQGWRRVSTIKSLHETSGREITAAHVKAAERLLGDYEIGIEGAVQSGTPSERVDGGSSAGISGARLDAMKRYRQAMEAIGATAALIVCKVVLDNWTVTELAAALGIHRDRAHGRLQAGLERLREHYWPPQQNPVLQAATVAESVADPGVADIPQERMGRWKAPRKPVAAV